MSSAAREPGRLRPNSFNLVPARDLPRAGGEPCPLRARPAEIEAELARTDRDRALFVRLVDRMRLFTTETGDFDGAELARIKWRSGQLYADVSKKIAPDDFARDLVKLSLCAECGDCELLSRCAGCFVPAERDVFTRDDARVRALLRALSGRVLDVGCGEAPYLNELDPTRVDYLGIDPDPRRIAILAARHPWAAFRAGTLAELEPERIFDHLLLLRSYNHLNDPRAALEPLITRLSPGGSLLVVDNVAFGLVRSRAHARSAEQGSAGFEHFRNDSASDAERALSGLGLELLERQEVGPHTSNQWFLHYRKGQP